MARKKASWIDTCERFVAYLDIMGFKDFVYTHSHSEVKDMLSRLHSAIKPIQRYANGQISGKLSSKKGQVRPVTFSDSIILISKDNSEESAEQIVKDVGYITMRAIILNRPISGAVAFGTQTSIFDDSLHFGRPLIEAYLLQKELKLLVTVLHHSAEKILAEYNIINRHENEYFFKYLVPFKRDKITHYILDWGQLYPKLKRELLGLYENVSGYPRIYIDNTMKFLKWQEKQIKKQNKK